MNYLNKFNNKTISIKEQFININFENIKTKKKEKQNKQNNMLNVK